MEWTTGMEMESDRNTDELFTTTDVCARLNTRRCSMIPCHCGRKVREPTIHWNFLRSTRYNECG